MHTWLSFTCSFWLYTCFYSLIQEPVANRLKITPHLQYAAPIPAPIVLPAQNLLQFIHQVLFLCGKHDETLQRFPEASRVVTFRCLVGR